MDNKPNKPTWQELVIALSNYHKMMLISDKKHSARKTANDLGYSIGAVSEALQLVHWMKVYPRLESFKKKSEALAYMKKVKLK